ncbi:MAG: hypothetical protein ABEN55_21880, partial [Bradymonadaceae bacterium]
MDVCRALLARLRRLEGSWWSAALLMAGALVWLTVTGVPTAVAQQDSGADADAEVTTSDSGPVGDTASTSADTGADTGSTAEVDTGKSGTGAKADTGSPAGDAGQEQHSLAKLKEGGTTSFLNRAVSFLGIFFLLGVAW